MYRNGSDVLGIFLPRQDQRDFFIFLNEFLFFNWGENKRKKVGVIRDDRYYINVYTPVPLSCIWGHVFCEAYCIRRSCMRDVVLRL